ncbi:MAG: type II toxin-antitoxin system VapC family toxin [Thermoleophilaceae bacterium]
MDSSAYVKLPLAERERDALRAELGRWEGYVSSALLSIEAVRACARYGPEYANQALAGLAGLALVPVDDKVMSAAARVEPSSLRTLDALHLATALSLGADVGVLIAYDQRLLAAADQHNIPTARPH